MPRAAEQPVDPVAFPTAERLLKGDIVVTGKGRQARARALNVVSKMDADCRLAAARIMQLAEAAEFSGWRCQRLGAGFGLRGTNFAEAVPSEKAEGARRALQRLGGKIDSDLWDVVTYRLIFSEAEEAVAVRLGLSRGQVSRRFVRGLRAVSAVLRGKR